MSANTAACWRGPSRSRLFATGLWLGWALLVVFALGPSRLRAQTSSTRLIHVAVTDPPGRAVFGLDQDRFEVLGRGGACPITDFADADSPLALAVVGETQWPGVDEFVRPEDELIPARSLPDAVQRLLASKKPRKVLVTAATSGIEAIPADTIQVVRTTPTNSAIAIKVALHQYWLRVKCSTSSASLNVVIDRPLGLPPLSLTWK